VHSSCPRFRTGHQLHVSASVLMKSERHARYTAACTLSSVLELRWVGGRHEWAQGSAAAVSRRWAPCSISGRRPRLLRCWVPQPSACLLHRARTREARRLRECRVASCTPGDRRRGPSLANTR
jgi:hypothetical protein